jgi:protein arginine kinase activator
MKCDKCNKKATVHLTEIVDGKVMEMHLCEECAREQSQQMEQQFGLADLLAGLTDFGKQIPEVQKDALQCSACGLTYEDFRKFGRFGCAQCYVAFKPQLKTLLKKIHGSNVHLGKKPVKIIDLETPVEAAAFEEAAEAATALKPVEPKVETVDSLRVKLQQAIAKEDFELAARLRDVIREMEQKG